MLVRERYFRQWRVYMSSSGSKVSARIYLAGPGMMYIPLRGCSFPCEVVLEYSELPAEKAASTASIALAIASLLVAALELGKQLTGYRMP